MRVATVDGLVTLYYDGSEWQRELSANRFDVPNLEDWNLTDECKNYIQERLSWQQVIVEEGVTVIPEGTFLNCLNIERVNFTDTVIRIETGAFHICKNLVYIKWSLNLEYIGRMSFSICNLCSVFIPPRCLEIGTRAFAGNANLTISNVPQDVDFGDEVVLGTKLHQRSPNPHYMNITWLMNINNDERFALHRVCSSFEPTLDTILDTMIEKGGPHAFKVENSIGITPSRYLKENSYIHVTEKEIIEKYILQMMGENS